MSAGAISFVNGVVSEATRRASPASSPSRKADKIYDDDFEEEREYNDAVVGILEYGNSVLRLGSTQDLVRAVVDSKPAESIQEDEEYEKLVNSLHQGGTSPGHVAEQSDHVVKPVVNVPVADPAAISDPTKMSEDDEYDNIVETLHVNTDEQRLPSAKPVPLSRSESINDRQISTEGYVTSPEPSPQRPTHDESTLSRHRRSSSAQLVADAISSASKSTLFIYTI